MANWYGSARTNYVRIKDMPGLEQALEPFGVRIGHHPSHDDFVCLDTSGSEDGDFPSYAIDEDGKEYEFSFEEHVVPYLAEGQVLIATSAGAEKLRYITGWAGAYAWDGRTHFINISQIAEEAAKAFGMDPRQIASATYADLPRALEDELADDSRRDEGHQAMRAAQGGG